MKTYKFRAECLVDVIKLRRIAQQSAYSMPVFSTMKITYDDRFPDVEVTVKTNRPKCLKCLMRKVPDSHVMIETFAKKSQYTGKGKRRYQ